MSNCSHRLSIKELEVLFLLVEQTTILDDEWHYNYETTLVKLEEKGIIDTYSPKDGERSKLTEKGKCHLIAVLELEFPSKVYVNQKGEQIDSSKLKGIVKHEY